MGINLDKVREALKNVGNTDNRSKYMWRPEAGDTTIRLVPYKHNPDYPITELMFYYNLGKRKVVLSPKSFGNPDPIVEFAEQLMGTGDTESWKAGRKMLPKKRYYAPIIVRGKEKEGVKFWGFPNTVYESILNIIMDDDFGDITDPKNGYDIVVTLKDGKDTGKSYGETSIRPKGKPTPVVSQADSELWPTIRDEQPELTELFSEPTYEELQTILNTLMNEVSEESSDDDNSIVETTEVRSSKSSNVKKASENFDDIFD
jgi:hypothetical protein